LIFNLLNLFIFPYFGLFRDLRGIITVQTQGSQSGIGKSDSRKYSCLQGRFSTVTIGLGLTKPNEALPSQRNNSQEGRQISTDNYKYNRDNPKNIKGLQTVLRKGSEANSGKG
jgi:hypothetical protein